MVLSLLGNTATLPEVLKAVSASSQSTVDTVTRLLSSQVPGLKVKAATLVGNLCHDASLRSQVCYTLTGHATHKHALPMNTVIAVGTKANPLANSMPPE